MCFFNMLYVYKMWKIEIENMVVYVGPTGVRGLIEIWCIASHRNSMSEMRGFPFFYQMCRCRRDQNIVCRLDGSVGLTLNH